MSATIAHSVHLEQHGPGCRRCRPCAAAAAGGADGDNVGPRGLAQLLLGIAACHGSAGPPSGAADGAGGSGAERGRAAARSEHALLRAITRPTAFHLPAVQKAAASALAQHWQQAA